MTIVVVDFDETITQSDTISILASIPYTKYPSAKLQPFSHFTNVYLNKYKELVAAVAKPTTIAAEKSYQQRMKEVELTSVKELERLKVFKGLTPQDISATALDQVKIRHGFRKFLSKCKSLKIPLMVLSVNWSSYMIQPFVPGCKVICNELQVDKTGVTTGKFEPVIHGIDGGIRTGYDKLRIISQLRQQYNGHSVVYIGDSRTDLLSLLSSDVGVVVPEARLLKDLPWPILISDKEMDAEVISEDSADDIIYKYDWDALCEYIEKW